MRERVPSELTDGVQNTRIRVRILLETVATRLTALTDDGAQLVHLDGRALDNV
jgi:hypothetical protein